MNISTQNRSEKQNNFYIAHETKFEAQPNHTIDFKQQFIKIKSINDFIISINKFLLIFLNR